MVSLGSVYREVFIKELEENVHSMVIFLYFLCKILNLGSHDLIIQIPIKRNCLRKDMPCISISVIWYMLVSPYREIFSSFIFYIQLENKRCKKKKKKTDIKKKYPKMLKYWDTKNH